MKIGIVTYTHGTNFGQRLQNYALQYKLEELGCEVYTIRQVEPYSLKTRIKHRIKHIVKECQNLVFGLDEIKREHKFNTFNKNHIYFYSRKISFNGKSKWLSKKFDAFVVGSDQIWSPISNCVGENSFLSFAESKQKLTYAPSLSVNEMPINKVAYYKEKLEDFRFISIREDNGREILEKITNKDVKVVVDPTLLLDKQDWEKIRNNCSIKPSKPYCLQVFLGGVPKESKFASDTLGLTNILVNAKTPISPAEFIDLVADAEYMLTDSFHATIFSTIYHVPFLNFSRNDFGNVMNGRFDTLYRIFGIHSRKNGECDLYDKIDFSYVDDCIRINKEYSLDFLKMELDSVI